ncbi:MAG TPA: response regulator [Candidatus Binatia bacterium]|nr:response regulator [Candidatus Binatia bacterium]
MQHTVLLVDDDRELLELFRHMLRREPYAVETARTAVDAFNILASRPVAVVISDERMPGMSGTELLARIQVEYPETIRMMITGQASVEVAMRAINEGQVYRFLTKPVRTAALISTLREAIAAWETQHDHGGPLPGGQRRMSEMEQLESEWHGLTHVERDASGAIVVEDSDADLAEVLREMESPATGQRRH